MTDGGTERQRGLFPLPYLIFRLGGEKMIYLDNAATTGFKPDRVIKVVETALKNYSANPGRSGHSLSISAAEKLYSVREKVADFFGSRDPLGVVFTLNCTQAVNFVLKGVLKKGDGLIISNLEHNCVARPAFKMANDGDITLDVFDAVGDQVESGIEALIKPNTKLIFCTHASNVCGKIIDIEKIGKICKKHNILFGVDAAQTAGVLPIDIKKMGIDFLCVASHKGLLAPMGTGILIAGKPIEKTVIEGGTGTASLSLYQPKELPEMLESGTVNLPGIFGIGAGIDFIKSKGIDNIYRHENALCKKFLKDVSYNKNISVILRSDKSEDFVPVIALNVKGKASEEVAELLSSKGIAVRGGYHCAPLAHRTLGSIDGGAVRISPGILTCVSDMEYLKKVLFLIAK